MKRSFREIVELIVIGVFGLVVANGLIWVLGHFLRFIGFLGHYVIIIAYWLWVPLRWISGLTLLIILAYLLIKHILKRRAISSNETTTSSIKTVTTSKESTSEASIESSNPTSNPSKEKVSSNKEETSEVTGSSSSKTGEDIDL